jgi:hypothetical protein
LKDFFLQNLWLYLMGGCIVAAGLVGAVLYIRKQGE